MDDTFDYCRDVEAYLCKKNGGHLVRIVGPAFEMVCGWAEQGVPLKVAFRGIDRTVDRHNAKGGRRRPLRIEFCEADVLDEFDAWRRATGITATGHTGSEATGDTGGEAAEGLESTGRRKRQALAAHIERAVSRLLALRVNGDDADFGEVIASTVSALDELVKDARTARGEARAAIVARLAELDAALVTAARGRIDAETTTALEREVAADLAPFASRMAEDARRRAASLAFDRLLREQCNLPVLSYE